MSSTSSEPPSPPSKDAQHQHQHHRSMSTISRASQRSRSRPTTPTPAPSLPPLGISQHVRGDTIDDLMATVGDAIADFSIGVGSETKGHMSDQKHHSWDDKSLPPIGSPRSSLDGPTNAGDLGRKDTWTSTMTGSSAFTGSSVVTSSSTQTGSSGITGSSTSSGISSSTYSSESHHTATKYNREREEDIDEDEDGEDGSRSMRDNRTYGSRTPSVRTFDYGRDKSVALDRQSSHGNGSPSSFRSDESPPSAYVPVGGSAMSRSHSNHTRATSTPTVALSATESKRRSIVRRKSSSLSVGRFVFGSGSSSHEKSSSSNSQNEHTHHRSQISSQQSHPPLSQLQLVPRTQGLPFPPSVSPLPPPPPERSRRLKTKAVGWPQPMTFREVLSMKTALDRAAAYAEKINQIMALDCGLSAWVFDATMQKRGTLY